MQRTVAYIILSITMNCFSQDTLPYFKKNEIEKYALFNTNGKALTKHKYSYVSDFNNGIAHIAEIRIEEDDYSYLLNQGFINPEGNVVIPIIYDEADTYYFSEKYVKMTLKNNIHFFDVKGNKIRAEVYYSIQD